MSSIHQLHLDRSVIRHIQTTQHISLMRPCNTSEKEKENLNVWSVRVQASGCNPHTCMSSSSLSLQNGLHRYNTLLDREMQCRQDSNREPGISQVSLEVDPKAQLLIITAGLTLCQFRLLLSLRPLFQGSPLLLLWLTLRNRPPTFCQLPT